MAEYKFFNMFIFLCVIQQVNRDKIKKTLQKRHQICMSIKKIEHRCIDVYVVSLAPIEPRLLEFVPLSFYICVHDKLYFQWYLHQFR